MLVALSRYRGTADLQIGGCGESPQARLLDYLAALTRFVDKAVIVQGELQYGQYLDRRY